MINKIITLLIGSAMVLVMLVGCAKTPEVMESVTVADSTTPVAEVTTQASVVETTAQKQETSDMIGEDAAIEIVLERIPGATESDVRIHYDRDDGRDIYEGSVIYNEMEYDFEIDARTGNIIEWESESIYD